MFTREVYYIANNKCTKEQMKLSDDPILTRELYHLFHSFKYCMIEALI